RRPPRSQLVPYTTLFRSGFARAEIAKDPAVLADNETRQMRLVALDIFLVNAVVPNLRVRHRHDLTSITGIGQDLLVSGHRSIKRSEEHTSELQSRENLVC